MIMLPAVLLQPKVLGKEGEEARGRAIISKEVRRAL